MPKLKLFLFSAPLALLSACGGGGGGGSRPEPTPPPPPPPPPGPSSSLDDAEYRHSDYAVAAHALAAYQQGYTGRGAKISIIDSGVDTGSPEFAGRIDPASTGLTDATGHGSGVARIAAGARNGAGSQGVAYDATILSINTLSCISNDCFHRLDDIAAAIDYSVANRADVINLSVVGPNSNANVQAAVDRASQAGIVVVIAAGNSGAANPDGFALQSVPSSPNGAFIIAGAYVGSSLASSRAGNGQAYFLAAHGGTTSESTPVISGAVALLAAAFPNLTGAEIVSILFASADDAGAPGVDPVWGHGILNIERAFQPLGATSFAGTDTKLATSAPGATSGPLGDFATRSGPRALVLDSYARAYSVDVAKTAGSVEQGQPLHQAALGAPSRTMSLGTGPINLSFSTIKRNEPELAKLSGSSGERLKAAYAIVRPRSGTTIAFAKGYSGLASEDLLSEKGRPAFVAASRSQSLDAIRQGDRTSFAVRQSISGAELVVSAESGRTLNKRSGSAPYFVTRMSVEEKIGALRVAAGVGRLIEHGTLLGASFGDAIGSVDAATTFADLEAELALGDFWTLGATYRRGWTAVRGSAGFLVGGTVGSDAFAFDLAKLGFAVPGDLFAIRLAQPLRARSGGLQLSLPVGYDHESRQATFGRRGLSLVPLGREIDFEGSYGRSLFGGYLSLNGYFRKEADNIAANRNDAGVMIRFTAR